MAATPATQQTVLGNERKEKRRAFGHNMPGQLMSIMLTHDYDIEWSLSKHVADDTMRMKAQEDDSTWIFCNREHWMLVFVATSDGISRGAQDLYTQASLRP